MSEPIRTVALTVAQWNKIGASLDVAVRQGGIAASAELLPIFGEIQQQIADQEKPNPTPTPEVEVGGK